jgi:hypothetical protein
LYKGTAKRSAILVATRNFFWIVVKTTYFFKMKRTQ